VEGVSKRFGGLAALQDVSFELPAGRIVGLIGPNGAGKTTLFNVISGLMAPTAGRIVLGERDVVGLSPDVICRLGISRTYQTVRTFLNLTARENVLVSHYFGRPEARRGEADSAAAEPWLALVGMADRADVPTRQLSLVERKLVEIARALATVPALLLLDEILAGLSVPEIERVLGLMRVVRERSVTVLWVEHLMRAVAGTCDRVIVLSSGRLLADGPPQVVMQDPRVVEAYLGRGERRGTRAVVR
jgi:branched-chain amino acid transport system ATP-binding protein